MASKRDLRDFVRYGVLASRPELYKAYMEQGLSLQDLREAVERDLPDCREFITELRCLEKAPVFLQAMYGDMRETCMHWGFELGAGWLPIVERLCEQAESLNRKYAGRATVKAEQVKQKWGELTVYYSVDGESPEELREEFKAVLIAAADKAAGTCERCGRPATHFTRGWISPACDECDKPKEKKNASKEEGLQG